MDSKFNYGYNYFINDLVPSWLNNYSYRNVSQRLMPKMDPETVGLFAKLNPGSGQALFNDVTRVTGDRATQNYFHEVGGHGTEEAFGVTRKQDPTNLTQKFLQSSSTSSPESPEYQTYLQSPNEMRARAISTRALITNFPNYSRSYFKVNSDGKITHLPAFSEANSLYDAFNHDWDAESHYLRDVYKQGGKL